MSIETIAESVVAVVASPNGKTLHFWEEVLPRLTEWSKDPVHKEFMKQEQLLRYFRELPKATAAWAARIQFLKLWNPTYLKYLAMTQKSVAFHSAMARMAAQEALVAHSARMAALNATATAAKGTLVAGSATTALCVVVPIVGMLAVQVALGAPYYQARQKARQDGYTAGFAKGLITGLLKWELRFAIERFWDNAVLNNPMDEAIPKIYANSHNQGLVDGRAAGIGKDDNEKKDYLLALRLLTNASSVGWTPRTNTGSDYGDWMEKERARQVQMGYVIGMASAARKYGFIGLF